MDTNLETAPPSANETAPAPVSEPVAPPSTSDPSLSLEDIREAFRGVVQELVPPKVEPVEAEQIQMPEAIVTQVADTGLQEMVATLLIKTYAPPEELMGLVPKDPKAALEFFESPGYKALLAKLELIKAPPVPAPAPANEPIAPEATRQQPASNTPKSWEDLKNNPLYIANLMGDL